MNSIYTQPGAEVDFLRWTSLFLPIILILIIWSMFWKGLALWHSGMRKQPGWFIVLLILNTAGILEIIYLFFVLKLNFSKLFSKNS